MPQFTKNAISEAFFRIAAKKAIEKITVKDIVEECGVTRNTFYYYFKDVYDVVEDAFLTVISDASGEKNDIFAVFEDIADFLYAHRKALRNIGSSVGYDQIQIYLAHAADPILYDSLKAQCVGRNVKDADIELMTDLISAAILGLLIDRLRSGMNDPLEDLLRRIRALCDGIAKKMIENVVYDGK